MIHLRYLITVISMGVITNVYIILLQTYFKNFLLQESLYEA